MTYPFADPAGVPATLQDPARTDIRLDLRGLLKAGHAKTIQLCKAKGERSRGQPRLLPPQDLLPTDAMVIVDDAPSIALGQPGKRELGKCADIWVCFWFVCAASSLAAAKAALWRPGFGKPQVGPMLG